MHLPARQGVGWARLPRMLPRAAPGSARMQPPASPGRPDGLLPHHGDSEEASAQNLVCGRGSPLGATWSNTGDTAGGQVGGQGATRPRGERRALWAQDSHHKGFAGLHCPQHRAQEALFNRSRLFSLVGAFCLCRVLAAARASLRLGPAGAALPWRCAGLSLRRRLLLQGTGSSVHGLQELWLLGPRAQAQ